MKRDLDFVVAMTEERVIGIENRLPWHLPEDLKHFRKLTTGNTVIMGRKTYDSIGKPLPNRKNIVLTRNRDFEAPGIVVCRDWEGLSGRIEGTGFVIGGGEIFRAALPRLRTLHLTRIFDSIPGDAFFPELDFEKDLVLDWKSETFEQPLRYRFERWLWRD